LGGFVGGYSYSTIAQPAVEVVEPPVEVVQPPFEVVERPPPIRPPLQVARWDDQDLTELVLNKFAFTRGLDRDGNKIVPVIVSKDFHDDTGAVAKVNFKVRWVEMKRTTDKHGNEVVQEKQKKTTVKLKFNEAGQFTEYDD